MQNHGLQKKIRIFYTDSEKYCEGKGEIEIKLKIEKK